jgi:hypothetical protein
MLHRLGPRKTKAKPVIPVSEHKKERLAVFFCAVIRHARIGPMDRLPASAETTASFCCGINGGESWDRRVRVARDRGRRRNGDPPLSQFSRNRAETEDCEKLSWVTPKLIHAPS